MTIRMMQTLVLLGGMAATASAQLPRWEFDDPADAKAWAANSHLAEVACSGGILSAKAIDSDPILHCRELSISAAPWQFVVLRVKASAPGIAELFWSGKTEGTIRRSDRGKKDSLFRPRRGLGGNRPVSLLAHRGSNPPASAGPV